ncbi:hypothetical protein [Streptomyces bobili]|uniref:hypothetical protein n=1 Tax=Streptomyces bobili TaxID=67280 RepID=UPI0037227003
MSEYTSADAPDPNAERYKLAYDAAQRQLASQDGSLGSLRNRATGLFAASAFLVTASTTLGLLGGDDRREFPLWASIALLCIIIVQGVLVMAVLWPARFHFGPNIDEMLNPRLREVSDTSPNEHLVEEMASLIDENIHTIERRCLLYQAAILCLLAEVSIVFAATISLR